MMYGVEGVFGSGKTSYIVHLMMTEYKDAFVWTNVRISQKMFPNSYIFNDGDLLDVLRSINEINDKERTLYTSDSPLGVPIYDRDKFTRHVIFFDEASSTFQAKDHKDVSSLLYQYLDQQRKNFLDLYFLAPHGQTILLGIRRHIIGWVSCSPLINIKLFGLDRWLRPTVIFKDPDGKPLLESYIGKDPRGDRVIKQRPIIEKRAVFNRRKVWFFYDDLYKNISDHYTSNASFRPLVDGWLVPESIEEKKE